PVADPDNAINGWVVTEPRALAQGAFESGISQVFVVFDMDMTGCYMPGQVIVDNGLVVDSDFLSPDGMQLTINVSNNTPYTAYTFDISASIWCSLFETTFVVRSCLGNTNGDIQTDTTDKAETAFYGGQTAGFFNAKCDVNLDGVIDNTDKAAVASMNGHVCP
ncbi:MAG: hypothetical protein GY778_04620, partial [bacterium]|nr:hypothetical protein [bacterium]